MILQSKLEAFEIAVKAAAIANGLIFVQGPDTIPTTSPTSVPNDQTSVQGQWRYTYLFAVANQ